jgi:Skp family chaperone for outer membrane proteins
MSKRIAVLMFGFSVVLAGFIAVGAHFRLNAEQWAAWIQAIGSVGAILASVALVQYQRRKEVQLAAEKERLTFQRKLNAMRALFMEVAQRCQAAAAKVHRDDVTWELEQAHLQEARALLTGLPVFDIPDAGLVMRIATISTQLQAAATVAQAMTSPRPEPVRDKVASILMSPHDQCLEAIVEVTNLLVKCCTEEELESAMQTFDRLEENMRRARDVMTSLRQKSQNGSSDPVAEGPLSVKPNVS